MTDMQWKKRLLVLTSVMAIAACVTSCSGSEKLSRVGVESVIGVWKGKSGETVNLQGDHRFTASGFDWGSLSSWDGCPQGEGAGIWAFWGSDPDSPQTSAALDKYIEGDTVNLSFEGVEQGTCLINLNAIDEGSSLCLSDDIEIPCSLDIKLVRQNSAAS
ncbi:hypothetical protein ACFWG5_08760 [Streptomyces hydrogenans]|uniref:hypothetical protein n=2 Tax=Streptomyces hydrogenans TaxID=1873719 RepID=UPI0036670B4B